MIVLACATLLCDRSVTLHVYPKITISGVKKKITSTKIKILLINSLLEWFGHKEIEHTIQFQRIGPLALGRFFLLPPLPEVNFQNS